MVPEPADDTPPPGTAVYVVDDDEAVRDSLALLLASAGLPVAVFASAVSFLAAVPAGRPGCVIADVRMPGMDGLTLQQRLAERGSQLAVIMMTGHADVPLAVQAMKAGAVDFVEKPFDGDALLASVRDALTRTAVGVGAASRSAAGPPAVDHSPGAPPAPPAADLPADADIAVLTARLARLTARERQVLGGLVAGHPNKVIAHNLQISPRTVEIHRARVMEKMQAGSLSQLVRMAMAAGAA